MRRQPSTDGLQELQRSWDALARHDPLWAVCTDPDKLGGRWDETEFFDTGEEEIRTMLGYLHMQGISVPVAGDSLDFGCGVGRLTQPLARRFTTACGVDISPTMIATAERFNLEAPRCRFVLNDRDDLSIFPDGSFTFVYSSIVLQHIPAEIAVAYIGEFVRVLAPGGVLVFQVPDRFKAHPGEPPARRSLADVIGRVRVALAVGTRARALLRGHLPRIEPEPTIQMNCVPEARIARLLGAMGVRLVDVALTNSTDLNFNGRLQYLHAEPDMGFISKQYCVLKGSHII